MKIKWLCLLAIITACVFQARGQVAAPDSVANTVISFSISSGIPPLATSGTARRVLTPSGQFYDIASGGNVLPGQTGTYTYTKISATVGRFIFVTQGFTGLDEQTDLTFLTAIGGSFSDRIISRPSATQSGTFSIAPFSTSAPLVNISTRAVLSPGQSLNPGFVIGGTIPRKVLIRAVGPTLASFGVSGTMSNPKLTVFSGSTVIGTNDDWGTPASNVLSLQQAFSATGAFSLVSGSSDAALVLTLAPGAYTALLQGSTTSDAGDVLLEIYFIE